MDKSLSAEQWLAKIVIVEYEGNVLQGWEPLEGRHDFLVQFETCTDRPAAGAPPVRLQSYTKPKDYNEPDGFDSLQCQDCTTQIL